MAGLANYVVFLCAALCFLTELVIGRRCPAYCDEIGRYQPETLCLDGDGGRFCCGTIDFRYCCGNSTLDISDKYDNVFICPHSSWWLFHWQVALGLLCSVIILLLIGACCCKICLKTASHGRTNRRNRRRANQRTDTDESVSTIFPDSSGSAPSPQVFNPESAFAFEPPPYETLPKNPPTYSSIFGGTGNTNEAFIADAIELPPYTPTETSTLVSIGEEEETDISNGNRNGPVYSTPTADEIHITSSSQPLTLAMISDGYMERFNSSVENGGSTSEVSNPTQSVATLYISRRPVE